MNVLTLVLFLAAAISLSSAFFAGSKRPQTGLLQMNFFKQLFGPKASVTASHILVKGGEGPAFLSKLKGQINAAPDKQAAFAKAAFQHSSCPSKQKGGSLGSFGPGQMVPAFDKVCFNEEVDVVHGPIKTQFGAHLIYIEERTEPEE